MPCIVLLQYFPTAALLVVGSLNMFDCLLAGRLGFRQAQHAERQIRLERERRVSCCKDKVNARR